jgi:hypothetical protein
LPVRESETPASVRISPGLAGMLPARAGTLVTEADDEPDWKRAVRTRHTLKLISETGSLPEESFALSSG